MSDDELSGCDIDFADPATVSTDDDVIAILCFGDIPWTGEVVDGRPEADPDLVAQRKADLEALNDA